MIIREAQLKDAKQIHDMHMNSIRENCKSHYTSKEIQAWGNRDYSEEHRQKTILNDFILVVEYKEKILGYSHFAYSGELRALYLDLKIIRKGFGKKLLKLVEEKAKSKGINKIFLHATLNAIEFYTHQGFVSNGTQHTIEINGEEIRCFPMIKNI
jgi:putative acetyltransferase